MNVSDTFNKSSWPDRTSLMSPPGMLNVLYWCGGVLFDWFIIEGVPSTPDLCQR